MVLIHEDQYGGGTRQTFYILEQLVRSGYQAVLVSNASDSWLGRRLRESGLQVITRFTSTIQRALHPVRDFQALLCLLKTIREERPDVLVTAGVKLVGLGCLAGWLMQVPLRVAIVRGRGGEEGTGMYRAIVLMEKFVAALGTRFITVCEFNRQQMIREGTCNDKNSLTIHNGADIAECRSGVRGRFRATLGLREDAFLIGMVGRLTPQKRYAAFIRMLAPLCQEFPHVTGLIIGDGPDREALQNCIEQAGLSGRIRITGFIQSMPDVYADLNASVLLTRYEGLANALLESSAAGVPMVADDVCGNAEIVRHGENGYIIPPEDLAGGTALLRQLILDPALCEALGRRGHEIAEADFDRQRQIERIIQNLVPLDDGRPAGVKTV